MTRIQKFKVQGKKLASEKGHSVSKFQSQIGIDIKVAKCANCTYIVGVDHDGYFGLCLERECVSIDDYK